VSEINQDNSMRDFVIEAEEIIEDLDKNLLAMEAAPDSSTIKPEIINAIFRGAHTLKGMAGMAGLEQVSELSHFLEDLFDKVRMGRKKLNRDIVDVLFEGVDFLRKLVERTSKNIKGVLDTSLIIKKIQDHMKDSGGQDQSDIIEKAGIDPEILKVLSEYESHRLMENIRNNSFLYEILASFNLDTFDKELTKIQSQIQSFGEIITNLPDTDLSSTNEIQFKLIVGSDHDFPFISESLGNLRLIINPMKSKTCLSPKNLEEGSHPLGKPDSSPSDGSEMETDSLGSIKSLSRSIRVDITKLDSLLNNVGELVLTKSNLNEISRKLKQDKEFSEIGLEMEKITQDFERRLAELQEGLVEVRLVHVGLVFDRMVRVVRKISKETGKKINLKFLGEDTRLDKLMIEEIADPLMHLIRNSIDHGVESPEERLKMGKPEIGTIQLHAKQKGNTVLIDVLDDGGGIDLKKVYKTAQKRGMVQENKEYTDQEIINFIFCPGFTTQENVSATSGRGVGMDVVAENIRKLSGEVEVNSEIGKGTKISISLPITLLIIKAIIVKVVSETYAIPLNSVSESFRLNHKNIKTIEGREVTYLRDHPLPLFRLDHAFHLNSSNKKQESMFVIVVGNSKNKVGLVVDSIQGQQEIVIKTIGKFLQGVPGISGATELGNKKTIMVLDVGVLIEEALYGSYPKIEHSVKT